MAKKTTFYLYFFLFLLFSTCLQSKELSKVKSWLYQLQDIDLTEVGKTDYDLIVMDYSKDGSGDQAFTKTEIQTLQNDGEKLVLAYLSIGEAEDYRDYWQADWEPGDPIWLDEENSNWEGNYKVLYWHPEWQQIILDYLKEIQKAGFDGVYLDLVDAYESYLHFSSVQSCKEMVDFVRMLGDSAKVADPDFIVIGQNAAEIIDYDPTYLEVVDGIGQEDMHYGYDGDGIKTSFQTTQEIEFYLDQFVQAEKMILTVDYPFAQSEDIPHFDSQTVVKIKDAYQQSRDKKYIPYCTVRNLNYLTMNPGHNQTYYVDQSHTNADDSNPGTEMLPFKTIQAAIDILEPGEKVLIKEGIYYESLNSDQDGYKEDQPEYPITIRNYPNHEVIIDGTHVNTSNTGLRIEHDYFHVSNLLFQNWNTGIWIDQAAFTQIDSCIVRDVWYGIGAANGAHHFELNHVEIYRFMLYGFDASPSGGDPCHHGVLNNCIAHTAADPEQNVDGFALGHGEQHDFILNYCTTYDVFDGFDLSAKKTTLNNCIAYHCGWGGVKIWQDSVLLNNCIIHNNQITNIELDWDDSPGSSTLIHCTLFNGGTWNINAYDNPSDKLYLYNCIVAGGDNVGVLIPESNYEGDYNLFHIDNPPRMIGGENREYSLSDIDSGIWTETTGQDSHSIAIYSDTSLFVDPDQYDFHLKENSPAIDKGGRTYRAPADFDGRSRSIYGGDYPDIGAYEYIIDTKRRSHARKDNIEFLLGLNYPNPFNHETRMSYTIPEKGSVCFVIFNIKGQMVWTQEIFNHSSGNYLFYWNGLDQQNRILGSGVYTIKMIYEERVKSRKLLLLK